MNILVLVKCVPDTETRIRIAPEGDRIDEGDVKWIVSPFDEYALEEALRIVEAKGEGTVTVVSVAGERHQSVLRQCLAMGAHRVMHLSDPAFLGGDGLSTARALAAACRKAGFDLILAGKQGVGHDRSQVPLMVAELLDLPHAAVVSKLELDDDKKATCHRAIEGGVEVIETSLPAVISAEKGLNEPRYASLKGIMAAKKKPIDVMTPADLELAPDQVGAAGAAETWSRVELPPARGEVHMIKGDAAEAANELVRLLSEEAKVI